MPGYRIEYASSGRAKCNGKKPCKGTLIPKGQIRFGTWVEIQDHGSFKWRHWGCLTSSVLENVANGLDDKIEDLDGYEDLKPEDQIKIKKAFQIKSVDPTDIPSSAIQEPPPSPTSKSNEISSLKVANGNENEDELGSSSKKRKRAPTSTTKKKKSN